MPRLTLRVASCALLFAAAPLLAASQLAACSDGGDLGPAPGPVDGGGDGGTDAARPDAPAPDLPPPFDAGTRDAESTDAGFFDPSIIAQGRIQVGEPDLYVTVRGTLTSTMPPLLILPTGPMHGQEYLYEPTEFLLGPGGRTAPDRLLVYVDPRGTGRSSRGSLDDAEISVEAHLRDMSSIADHVEEVTGRSGPIDILGHGYGAALAALFAAEAPERVRRLVLSNPFPTDVLEYSLWNEAYRARLSGSDLARLNDVTDFRVCFQDIRRCSVDTWNIIGPTWFCPQNQQLLFEMSFVHLNLRPFRFEIDQDLRRSQYDWSVTLGRIPSGIPTTVISGPCDPIPASAPATYTSSIAGARQHVVPGSGHFTLVEQAEEFRRIVRGALTD